VIAGNELIELDVSRRESSAMDRKYTPQADESELPLFGGNPVKPKPKPVPVQEKELRRVTGNIGQAIESFFGELQDGQEFHAGDLHMYVHERCGGAPASADRVMRSMRQLGQVSYEVVSRSNSLYRKG
jgi:hypothetical protein